VLEVPAGKGEGPSGGEPEGGKKPTATGGGKNTVTSEASGDGPAAGPDTCGGPVAGRGTERRVVLEQRFKVSFGADQGLLDKLETVRSLLSSKRHRRLEIAELLETVLDEYIDRHSPEARLGRTEKRRRKKERQQRDTEAGKRAAGACPPPESPDKPERTSGGRAASRDREGSRYIPRRVRDQVYARDGGRCAFVSAGGRRCASTWDLQIDHIVPFARGGDSSPSNLRLLCGRHNRLEAERAYGKGHMERYVGRDRAEKVRESAGRYRVGGPWGPTRESGGRYDAREVRRHDTKNFGWHIKDNIGEHIDTSDIQGASDYSPIILTRTRFLRRPSNSP
jgi:5-methylcytosine-specific restriction endonuclease McrA